MNEPLARSGVVAVVKRDERLLVIRRSATVVAPLRYCFPGGGIELGESESAALVREMREELSAAIRPIRRVWQSRTPWGVDLSWWLAEIDGEITCNPAEVASCHWWTVDEMQAQAELLESNQHFLAALASGEICLAAQSPIGDTTPAARTGG
jgi:8-oxo-dGTP pyrophosphatase MutT (NUDIX family)